MSDTEDSTPAVWDPSARDGAGGWVRRRDPARPGVPAPSPAPAPSPSAEQPSSSESAGGPVGGGDEEPTALLPRIPEPPRVRPYLSASPSLPTPPPAAGPHEPAGGGLPLFRPDPAQPIQAVQPQRPPLYPQPGGYPYPQPGPGPVQAAEEPGRRISRPLLVAAVIVAAALLGGVAVWALGPSGSSGHPAASGSRPPVGAATGSAPAQGSPGAPGGAPGGGSGSAAPSGSANASPGGGQAEAAAVDQLLAQSSSSRQQVVDAVAAAAQCATPADVSAAQTALTQAASARQALVSRLDALDVTQVPGGAAAVQVLAKAWTESAAADTAYAAWAGDLAASGCTPGNAPQNADYANGGTQSGLATTDKNTFIDLWTPIAMQYGLPTRTADAI
ncbi:hypothetical protein GXW83_07955 [Streptacidiphilus sp. PB12-B1b]|uniref:hypothetical protein n=1 Tax=Streptacidiphilus sp. PB12-B1b TaxID=2705012 RepID=UPI0015FC703C|nr:hypothetical protein [Streptacidiphilus sp. PB12-B1b]QMU75682.1 hypothetical protein GXW83_07955 [Streptacidiphilus sp. PB12-B1b]